MVDRYVTSTAIAAQLGRKRTGVARSLGPGTAATDTNTPVTDTAARSAATATSRAVRCPTVKPYINTIGIGPTVATITQRHGTRANQPTVTSKVNTTTSGPTVMLEADAKTEPAVMAR